MKTLVSKFLYLALLATLVAACSDDSGSSVDECPECTMPASSEALAWPGALGRFHVTPTEINSAYPWFEGETTDWTDTDGVAPEVPGCHKETTNPPLITPQRFFGELCLDETRLVETNPNKDVVHPHNDDLGSPDVFNCNTYCMDLYSVAGSCKEVVGPVDVCLTSAICLCE